MKASVLVLCFSSSFLQFNQKRLLVFNLKNTPKLFFVKTHFLRINMGSLRDFLYQKMAFFVRVLWVSAFTLFGLIGQCFFRLWEKYMIQKRNCTSLIQHQGDDNDNFGEEEEPESFLRFRFQTYEEIIGKNNGQSLNIQAAHSANDEVLCEDSDEKFHNIEANEYVGPEIRSDTGGSHSDSTYHLEQFVGPRITSKVTGIESVDKFLHVGNITEDDEPLVKKDSPEVIQNEAKPSQSVNYWTYNEDILRSTLHFPRDDDDDESLVSDSDSDSMVSSSKFSFRSSFIDSITDGFLSDIDFERAYEVESSMEFDGKEVKSTEKFLPEHDVELQNLSSGYESETEDFEDEDEEILEELKNLVEPNLESKAETKQDAEEPISGEQLSSDSEEQNGLETQWEHQDLMEQLKMEIRKARAIGLPTIQEECETPKIMDDLKPWKIDEKFQHEGTMDELHNFYRSYREKMRKLDILNYQKMYAIGFLRLKDPLQSFTRPGISTPAMASIISLDCWPCKSKSLSKIHEPVMKKFTKELESDLEMVYVGQMCLSWEFLHWEYGKALELWDSDSLGIRRYNEVAEKFQQFQVLLTRFLEDEPFQGPRVQHYVKTRCVHRNLLQVPVIREDNWKERKKERKTESSKDAITSVMLVEIIEECIRTLWRFIRADKSNASLIKYRRGSDVKLQNPADANLLAEVQSSLQKKAKKLKELSRSENCILKKFQKHQVEDNSDHVLYFFSQVDLRLVSRVLNMSKITTEQLVWCSDKLSKINLVGRKLYVEPSFLLFPC